MGKIGANIYLSCSWLTNKAWQIKTFLVREIWKLVREKSVKSQGILIFLICGNPAVSKELTGPMLLYCYRYVVSYSNPAEVVRLTEPGYSHSVSFSKVSKQQMSRNMRFPTIWYVRPAKPQISMAYAQSDQSLCYSLEYSMTLRPQTEHPFEFLSLAGG